MRLLILMTIGFFCCTPPTLEKKEPLTSEEMLENLESDVQTGENIVGDFNGDGQPDTATAVLVKAGKGNPGEGGSHDDFEIRFSAKGLKPIKVGCCDVRLVNEKDLNKGGADEISVFQSPYNGCTYSMTTYTIAKGKWTPLVKTFLVPTACENISDDQLQQRVFLENDTLYYFEPDLNDENGQLIRKMVK